MPRITDLTEAEVLEQLQASGASQEMIDATLRGFAKAAERAAVDDPELRSLRDKWLAVDVPRQWVVHARGVDGGCVDNVKTGRRVILSMAREEDGEVWLHASISRRDRALPTYEDLKTVHRLFMPGLVAYQLFMPSDEHVNLAEVLHLWACVTRRVTPDFTGGTGSV